MFDDLNTRISHTRVKINNDQEMQKVNKSKQQIVPL